MAQLDALRLTESLRSRLVDFGADDHFTRDPALANACRRLWSGRPQDGGLISELWVEGAFPAEPSTETLDTLVSRQLFSHELRDQLDQAGAMPRARPLYTHQLEAVQAGGQVADDGQRPALVVTAGTGAGKTECFLLPLLNDLYRRPPSDEGMQCLILYPMNALVNDQVDRLYNWLKGQERVTLFHFTSETPENRYRADQDDVPVWEPCRYRTRQQARGLETKDGKQTTGGKLPHIVITNYSMLEYMLCRPQDACFFGPTLRAVVLDEAHLYTGTLAAELTLLLRRLYERCGVDARNVLQIATSATLKQGESEELRPFAATLFSKPPEAVTLIEGRTTRARMAPAMAPEREPSTDSIAMVNWVDRPLLVVDGEGRTTMAESADLCNRLRDNLRLLTSAEPPALEVRPAALLHSVLGAAPMIHRLEQILATEKRLPLPDLADRLLGARGDDEIRATTALLRLGASARERADGYPLVPHRIHLLARAPDGLVVCLNSECTGEGDSKVPPLGTVSSAVHDHCPACESAMLSLYRCGNCGEWLLAGLLEPKGNCYRPVANPGASKVEFFSTRWDMAPGRPIMTLGLARAERLGDGSFGLQVASVCNCPHCGAEHADFRPFGTNAALALSILAETALAELPEFPAVHNLYLPARGRRMLVFSDSRQEAARLGPRLTRQHEQQLARAAIANVAAGQARATGDLVQRLSRDVERLELERGEVNDPDLATEIEDELRKKRQRLQNLLAGGSIDDWSRKLASQDRLAETLDAETGQHHSASTQIDAQERPWGQLDWTANWERVKEQTTMLLAREFATPSWRALSAETLGLVEVTYPGLDALSPPAALGGLPEQSVRDALGRCWPDVLRGLCDTLRVDGIITLGERHDDQAYQFGGVPIGRWSARTETGFILRRFVGEKLEQRRLRFMAAVLKACGLPEEHTVEQAGALLRAAFDQLISHATPTGQEGAPQCWPWLERGEIQTREGNPAPALRLIFRHLGLRRPTQLFRCVRTGHVFSRAVVGCAPEIGSEETLRPVTEAELDADLRVGRLRREYRESLVFRLGLWAEEHSAQLDPKNNRRLQDLFRAGIRNILSATTTLELGIDIGGLTAVMMSNVPPGKANYLQRAGRAGRRADGSSAVLTFARPRPFDREVFGRFGSYLDKPLRKPLVFLTRDRVVRRHLHAYLLGEFFREMYGPDDRKGAMDAFGKMGIFCGRPRIPYWKDANDPPTVPAPSPGTSLEARFLEQLHRFRDNGDARRQEAAVRLFEGSDEMRKRLDDWPTLMKEVISAFSDAIADWGGDYDRLYTSWLEAVQAQAKPQANAIRYQLKLLWELTVIEALADRQFLPRYGFPIGLQKLRIIAPDAKDERRCREEDQFRLERPGLLAMGEYVPGSQLLVGGKLVTSRGVLKHWTGASLDGSPGLRGRYCRCAGDHVYYGIADLEPACPICGESPRESPMDLLFVKYGFTSAAWDPPRWSTDVERVGTAETLTITFRPGEAGDGGVRCTDFGGIAGLAVDYREDGELLVYNRGGRKEKRGFAICLQCGYAQAETKIGRGRVDLPSRFDRHPPITATGAWQTCWAPNGPAPILRNQVLAARETTDVLLLDSVVRI